MVASEEECIDRLRTAVSDLIADKEHLQLFCSHSCYKRYIRARNGDVAKATKMLRETLAWREQEAVHRIRWDDVAPDASTGKIVLAPAKAFSGHPVLIMRPKYENNLKDQARNIRHFIYQMEMASRMADVESPDGKLDWIINYDGYTSKNSPPLATSLAILRILQSHYPERLHQALLWHPPTLFQMVWRAVSPFVDPVTRDKMVFFMKKDPGSGAALAARLDVTPLDKSLGGEKDDMYDPAAVALRMRAADALYEKQLAGMRRTEGSTGADDRHQELEAPNNVAMAASA